MSWIPCYHQQSCCNPLFSGGEGIYLQWAQHVHCVFQKRLKDQGDICVWHVKKSLCACPALQHSFRLLWLSNGAREMSALSLCQPSADGWQWCLWHRVPVSAQPSPALSSSITSDSATLKPGSAAMVGKLSGITNLGRDGTASESLPDPSLKFLTSEFSLSVCLAFAHSRQ